LEKISEQLLKERTKRVDDAAQLKVPDRVPLVIPFSFFPAKYAGVTCEDAYYQPAKWKAAVIKTVVDFAPDMCFFAGPVPGLALEALDFKQILWPGHRLSPHHTFQFVEGEYMMADEYDAFLADPSDFMVRTYLPRVCGMLEPFKALPPLSLLWGYTTLIAGVAMPELDRALESLLKARQEVLKYNREMGNIGAELEQLGFAQFSQSATFTPFDVISDRLRGMRGSMLDMYRQPDKLLQACEQILPIVTGIAISNARRSRNNRVFIPLHRGAEGFMSIKQFETFYWPTFKRLLQGLIDAGLVPCPFFEGDYTSRLEYFLEMPRGKIIGHFDTSDIAKTKQVLGNHMCIMGNVPSSILQAGTVEDVREYCRKLIDVAGKGGGFIMAPRSSIDEAEPENLKAMFDIAKEYGVYR
jgi:hypothetical protein